MAENELGSDKKKQWAETLFMQGNDTQKEIAATVGVSEQSICAWAKDGMWDERRKSLHVTNAELIRDFKEILDGMRKEARIAATDGDPNTKPDMDGIYKMTLAIKKLEDKAGVGETILTIKSLIKFIQPEDLELAKEVTKWGDLFIQSRLKAN